MSKPRLLLSLMATRWRAELSDSTSQLPNRVAAEEAVAVSVVVVVAVAADSEVEEVVSEETEAVEADVEAVEAEEEEFLQEVKLPSKGSRARKSLSEI